MIVDIKFWFLLLNICTFSVELTLANRKSFGEECDRIHKCDKAAWLSCRDGKCGCSKPDEMLYDQDMKKCMTKSGERCKYGGADNEESALVEITDCVQNSICGGNGVCQCGLKYHEIYNGTCGLSLLLGGNCSEENQCSKFAGLHCVDSMCECKYGVFSKERGLCVGKSQSDCIQNECVDGAICVRGKCLCDSDYYHSAEKTCLSRKTIFQDCNRDVECLQADPLKLRCISGKCDCPDTLKFSTVQIYEYSVYNRFQTVGGYKPFAIGFNEPFVEICAPRLEERCPDGYCTENAICDAEPQESSTAPISLGICRCINNEYSPNKDFQYCASNYGKNCVQNSDCIDDLVCSAGKCNCPLPLHQSFDYSTETCVTKIGGHCTDTSTCVPYSSCVNLSSSNTSGHCRCNVNFVVNKDRNCDLAYGARCHGEREQCDTIAGLSCVDNKCSCPDAMYKYDGTSRKCFGLVGSTCGEVIRCKFDPEKNCHSTFYACIENAYCENDQSLHECVCVDGYMETDNFTCASDAEIKSQLAKVTDNLSHSGELDLTKAQEITYDEGNCNSNMYTCNNGQCIHSEWFCDGIVHCDDNSDEIGCPEIENIITENENVCGPEWACHSGDCISRNQFCDNNTNCEDGSDEPERCQLTVDCGPNFSCSSGDCVERNLICNGINDCKDGSDEEICSM